MKVVYLHGLNDHEIRELITHVTNGIVKGLIGFNLPQCLRSIVHRAVMEYLTVNSLRLDEIKKALESLGNEVS